MYNSMKIDSETVRTEVNSLKLNLPSTVTSTTYPICDLCDVSDGTVVFPFSRSPFLPCFCFVCELVAALDRPFSEV